jgi:hypothetical protein
MTERQRVQVPRSDATLARRPEPDGVEDLLRRLAEALGKNPEVAIQLVEAAETLAAGREVTAIARPRSEPKQVVVTSCGGCDWRDSESGECCIDPPIAAHTNLGYSAGRPKVQEDTRACSRCEPRTGGRR